MTSTFEVVFVNSSFVIFQTFLFFFFLVPLKTKDNFIGGSFSWIFFFDPECANFDASFHFDIFLKADLVN